MRLFDFLDSIHQNVSMGESLPSLFSQLTSQRSSCVTVIIRGLLRWNSCKFISESAFVAKIIELYSLYLQELKTLSQIPQIYQRSHINFLLHSLFLANSTWNKVNGIQLVQLKLGVLQVGSQAI